MRERPTEPGPRGISNLGFAGCLFQLGAVAGAVVLGGGITFVIEQTVMGHGAPRVPGIAFGGSGSPSPSRPAADRPSRSRTPAPPTVTLEKQVRRLVLDRGPGKARKGTAAPVVRLNRVGPGGAWVLGSSATPARDGAMPEPVLFVAHGTGTQWKVELAGSKGFADLLDEVPASVVPAGERAALTKYDTKPAPDADTGLMLPWTTGQQWKLRAPGADESLGFDAAGDDTMVRAAGPGRLYRLCSSSPDRGLLVIVHPGGLVSQYYQLAGTTHRPDGSLVKRGDYLGRAGTDRPCGGGPADRPGLRFALSAGPRKIPLDGMKIGGWKLRNKDGKIFAERGGKRLDEGSLLPNLGILSPGGGILPTPSDPPGGSA